MDFTQITGLVEEIVFRNPDTLFTVIEVSSDGELITAVGSLPEISVGEKVVLTGAWQMNRSFGRQFKIERFERYLPDTSAQFLKYLSSGAIKGIGPKTAAKIVERFGDNTFNVIENEPERLTFIKGMSLQKAEKFSNEFKKQFSVRTVILSLEKYGLSPSECIKIFKKLGVNAPQIIEMNPYILTGSSGVISFERAEKIASLLPSPPEQKHRLRAGIDHILRHNLGLGHTCLPLKRVIPLCMNLLKVSENDVNDALSEMLDNKMIMSVKKKENIFLCLPECYEAEKTIAEKINFFLKFSASDMNAADDEIDLIEKENNIKYEEKQREAIKLSAKGGLVVLTGGPGTGKTTTVKGIINFFSRKNFDIVLAAPTGRAAKRMTELTGREAKTIHRLLEVTWSQDEEPQFKRNRNNPLNADAIILDECSMIDIFLFTAFLDAVKFGRRIILVGDSDQLPAVGAGNVLHDIIASEKVPVVRLTEIFRQAKESLIVTNAHDIINGKNPKTGGRNGDFFIIEKTDPLDASETVLELSSKRLPCAYNYSPLYDIQVLTPSKKGVCGANMLNIKLRDKLNPPSELKPEFRSGAKTFRKNDKVMQIKNNYNIEWTKNEEAGTGIFNGDVGIISDIDLKTGVITVDFDDGKRAAYQFSETDELELAYAITVHKSQGSEYNAVILALSDTPPQLLYRNLLYTAMTRARKLMIIVGNREKLYKMVENNVQNKRYTALKNFLCDDETGDKNE